MTVLSSRPQPGRPTISTRQAAKLLRRDARTVRRMIRDGELEGGCQILNERTRWFVYSDQITAPTRPSGRQQSAADASELEELRAAVARATAETLATQETNRLLLASQGLLVTALGQYQRATEEAVAIANEYRELSGRHNDAAERFRDSADKFATVIGNYRDIIGQYTTPDDLSSLGSGPD